MPRQELHSDTLEIEQKAPISFDEPKDEIIVVDKDAIGNEEWLADIAFMEEPVTIRLEPSADKNASRWFPVWVNGKGAEVFMNGRWVEFKHLPVGEVIVTKRKYLEVIIRAKIDTISTAEMDTSVANPDNPTFRSTTRVQSFSIIADKNPRGGAWATELMRRNY